MQSPKVTMPYVRLGKSGLKVSKLILGCMSYGHKSRMGWVLEGDEAIEHIKAAWAAGINTFDTADMYSSGESERLLGKALQQIGAPRSSYVILTKTYFAVLPEGTSDAAFFNPDKHGLANAAGLSRKHIFDSIKASLERLQVEYVDVLQCHRFDYETPIEETMRALHDVVQAGYARYIGMSSCDAWQFHMMQNYAINNGLTPFISMQNYHNLLYREEEREMLPVCKHFGVGVIPYSPLSRGLLSHPRNKQEQSLRSEKDIYISLLGSPNEEIDNTIIDRVEEVAKKKGISMGQVGLAWSMHKAGVSAPIMGTTSLKHLEDMIKAIEVTLTEEEIKYLEEPYRSVPIVGHNNST